MPISRASFLRYTLLFLLIGLGALVAVVGTTVGLVNRTQDYVADISTTRQFRSAAADLRSALLDAETGQRGFILTGEETYLAPFEQARAQLQGRIGVLKAALPDWTDVNGEFDRLAQAVAGKLAELSNTIELRRRGRTDEAVQIVRDGEGKALMDDARAVLDGFLRLADDHLGELVADQRANADALWWVSIVGGLMILGVTGLAVFTVQRYTKEILEARNEVEALNAGLEERVRERTAELARANDEIQRFAYIVTHDLRAPLVNIMGFASELEASVTPLQAYVTQAARPGEPAYEEARRAAQEDLPEALDFIRSSTKKMDGLINAILRLAREGKRVLRPEPVDVTAMVSASVAAIGHQVADAQGEVGVDIQLPRVVTDRLSLEQIIGNLIDNAVKYRRPDVPLRLAVRGRREGLVRFRLEVEDNGRGVAPQDLERVFELFRRSGPQDRAGEGIGLAHVRTMVRNLGGEIGLTSTLGQGSTFSVVLPLDLRVVTRSVAA